MDNCSAEKRSKKGVCTPLSLSIFRNTAMPWIPNGVQDQIKSQIPPSLGSFHKTTSVRKTPLKTFHPLWQLPKEAFTEDKFGRTGPLKIRSTLPPILNNFPGGNNSQGGLFTPNAFYCGLIVKTKTKKNVDKNG